MKVQIHSDHILLDDQAVPQSGSAQLYEQGSALTQFAVINGVPYRLTPLTRCGYRFQLGADAEHLEQCPIYVEGPSSPYCETHASLHRARAIRANAERAEEPLPLDRDKLRTQMLKRYPNMTSAQFEILFPEESVDVQ